MSGRKKTSPEGRNANLEFLRRRSKRLLEHKGAIEFVNNDGLSAETIARFFFGLSEPYVDSRKTVHENALVAPVINEKGEPSSKSVYFNLLGITVNPADENFWFNGSPMTYHSSAYKDQPAVFICRSMKDLWRLSQLTFGTPYESGIFFIASSKDDIFPEEWYREEFWERFERIYTCFPKNTNGDAFAQVISRIAGQTAKRVFPPDPTDSDWKSFCLDENNDSEAFRNILEKANVIGVKLESEKSEIAPGRYGYQPVDIAGAFHNGFLYYPIRTLNVVRENYRDEPGNFGSQDLSKKEVVLIRSDRTYQHVLQMPAPRGTLLNERVLRLSDGTLIDSHPKVSVHSTWSWNSIEDFHDGKSRIRPLDEILHDIKAFLKNSVWLPYQNDYDLLTLLVPVTFAQAIFQSVPLILVTGPPGSGKSSLGRAMTKICANAVTVGQISAAAVARLIDETKGFVVFDDLEAIGRRKKRDGGNFSELVQSLKLSYNKQTSWKDYTDVGSGMTPKRLNFFGVKMINNTSGTDHILGSRSLKIYMQRMPLSLRQNFGLSEDWNPVVLSNLRDELHTWTFENVGLIGETYRRLFSFVSDRDSEITAPLKVFAEIAGDTDITDGFNRALAFQNSVSDISADPVGLMRESVKRLILSGYTHLSPTHISLEMKQIASESPAFPHDDDPKWESIIWLGRQLRSQCLIDVNSPFERDSLHGKSLRVYPLNEKFVIDTLKRYGGGQPIERQKASGFCSACEECKYRNIDCAIRDSRYGKKRIRLRKSK